MNSVIKRSLGAVQALIIIVFVFVALISFSSRIPFLSKLGLNFFYVVSGSMEPTIPTGSLIYVGNYKLENLKPKDIITFYLRDDKSGAVSVVTHRISDIRKTEQTQQTKDANGKESSKLLRSYEIVTKGDANTSIDLRTTPPGNVIGVYRWHIPYLGYIANFAQTTNGFVLLIILPAVILIIWEIIDVVIYFKRRAEETSQNEIAELKAQLARAKDGGKSPKKR